MIPTDERLALLAQQGDGKATERLLKKYKPLVLSLCSRCRIGGVTSDDLIQEGMIGLYRAIMSYRPERCDRFSAFASLCVRRRMSSVIRSGNKKRNEPLNTSVSLDHPLTEGSPRTIGETLVQKGGDPEEIFLAGERKRRLVHLTDTSLSKLEKRVLVGFLHDRSYQDIARSLGISVKSVDNALQRIKHKLSQR